MSIGSFEIDELIGLHVIGSFESKSTDRCACILVVLKIDKLIGLLVDW